MWMWMLAKYALPYRLILSDALSREEKDIRYDRCKTKFVHPFGNL